MNNNESKILMPSRKVNPEKIKEIVKQIMDNGVIDSPFDYMFRSNITSHPETNHDLLNLPGKFKNIESTDAFIEGKGDLQIDFLESVLPDNEIIKKESSVYLGQETGRISDDKIGAIFNYCLSSTISLKKPCYPFVATNYEYDVDFLVREIEGFLLKIYLIIFDKEKIYEILNTLNSKDYSKEEFSESDYLQSIYILVFSKKPYACDVIEKLIKIFLAIENIIPEYQNDLYLAICMMVKYHFRDDNDKIEELITMMTEVMQDEVLQKLPVREKDKIEIARLTEKLERSEKQRVAMEVKLKKELNEFFVNEYAEKFSQKDCELSKKDLILSEKDELIKELKKEIEKYKRIDLVKSESSLTV